MIAGVCYGAEYGGSIASILMNIPGTPSSSITCIDGYPMARAGRAGVALFASAIASFGGGMIGMIVMAAPSPRADRAGAELRADGVFQRDPSGAGRGLGGLERQPAEGRGRGGRGPDAGRRRRRHDHGGHAVQDGHPRSARRRQPGDRRHGAVRRRRADRLDQGQSARRAANPARLCAVLPQPGGMARDGQAHPARRRHRQPRRRIARHRPHRRLGHRLCGREAALAQPGAVRQGRDRGRGRARSRRQRGEPDRLCAHPDAGRARRRVDGAGHRRPDDPRRHPPARACWWSMPTCSGGWWPAS